ncbi:MAG: hypothetical protein AAB481_04710 [Patescibacteria group bacterium]
MKFFKGVKRSRGIPECHDDVRLGGGLAKGGLAHDGAAAQALAQGDRVTLPGGVDHIDDVEVIRCLGFGYLHS